MNSQKCYKMQHFVNTAGPNSQVVCESWQQSVNSVECNREIIHLNCVPRIVLQTIKMEDEFSTAEPFTTKSEQTATLVGSYLIFSVCVTHTLQSCHTYWWRVSLSWIQEYWLSIHRTPHTTSKNNVLTLGCLSMSYCVVLHGTCVHHCRLWGKSPLKMWAVHDLP